MYEIGRYVEFQHRCQPFKTPFGTATVAVFGGWIVSHNDDKTYRVKLKGNSKTGLKRQFVDIADCEILNSN